GILHVSAKDKATGKENKITIKANSGLSEDEIEKMVKDAEAHAEDDRKMVETVQARNSLDALVHSVKKSVAEYGDKVGAEDKAKIEAAVKDAEELLKQNDATKEQLEPKVEKPARRRRNWARSCTRRRRAPGVAAPAGKGAGRVAMQRAADSTGKR